MDVEVYIIVPDGFSDAGEEALVCKAFYGTKQAGRLWGIQFSKALTSLGAVRTEADPCLYDLKVDGHGVTIEVHVDDILVVGCDLPTVVNVNGLIAQRFDVRDLCQVSDYLGMQVRWDRDGGTVTLGNPRHTAGLLADFGMEDARPNVTPVE